MNLDDIRTESLGVDYSDHIATITLRRPQILNALNRSQRQALGAALTALEANEEVRVIVLTGEGRAFCAGQDQNESAAMTAEDSARRIQDYMDLYRIIRGLGKPLIARIQGYATGSGLQIALLCDMRIASADAKVGMPELKVGSAAITGSALMLPVAGEAVMKRLVLTGDIIDAEQAQTMGLLDEVHPDETSLDERITALTRQLAGWRPMAVRITKQWWKKMSDEQFEQAAHEAAHAHAANYASGGYTDGARAFVEQRRARKNG